MLTPSLGAGGGISVMRKPWSGPSTGKELAVIGSTCAERVWRRTSMLTQVRAILRHSMPSRWSFSHRRLLPVACLLASDKAVSGISLVCHGGEVWSARPRARLLVEKQLMHRADYGSSRPAASLRGFSRAFAQRPSSPPACPRHGSVLWLLPQKQPPQDSGANSCDCLPATRLAKERRCPSCSSALTSLGRRDVRLILCGSGQPTPELQRLVGEHDCCTLRAGLSDGELSGPACHGGSVCAGYAD